MALAIQTAGLDVGYTIGATRLAVLTGLDLTIEAGCFLSILGPSGCGKSTFLRVVADLLEPLDGSISVLGGSPAQSRQRRDAGFVFQDSTLLPWRTVLQNVLLPLTVGRRDGSATGRRRAGELLEMMGLSQLADRYPSQLSGGQKQRVSIARALISDPRLLLMDEPFGALDEITRDRLNDELLNIWRRTGATIVFVTHSIMEAVYLGERVLVLAANPGRVVMDRDLRPLKQDGNRCSREDPVVIAAMAELRRALEHAA